MSIVVNCRPSQQLLSSCCTARCRETQYFTMGHPSPQNCPFAWTDLDPHLYMVVCAHPSPQTKRHLDRFSDFCRGDVRDRQTNRPTDHATRSVTIGRIYVLYIARCKKQELSMGRKDGGTVAPLSRAGTWVPSSNVVWAEVYFRTKWHLRPSSRLATIDMGRKLGAVLLLGGTWVSI